METDQISQIATELRTFIRQKFKIPENDADFSDDVHLFDYGYIDSFGAVDLTTFVDSAFSTKITDSDLVAFPLNTIREIATFVSKRKNGTI
ncbi:MAG TPA: acyl carrier protein [Verrucomicrobiae bacterium]|nr:acyl carrier protein [Verrucomicrobiae bacterium]